MPPRKSRKAAGQVKVEPRAEPQDEPQAEPRELGVVEREKPSEPSVVKTEEPRQLGVVKTEASAPQRDGEVGWPWLTDLPYSATDPELVLVAMYPGAPVPDHVRQFVASIICRTGMPDYVVEAAAWVILWCQRAAAAKDLGIKSITRILYSLSMGSCMSYVVARQLEPYHIGPSFSVEERRNVQAAAKAILHQVETYRNQYGRKFCVPAVEPPDTDPYWAMVVSICSTWATAIHVMQRDSANLPTDQFMEVRGHPVHMMVYRMSSVGGAYSQRYYAVTARQMDQPCPYIADVLEVLQCAQYVPQEGRAQLVERALEDILGARATKATVHRLAQLVTHTITFTRCSPGFQARNPDIHKQVTSIVDPLFSDGAAQWPATKAMVMESPWHFAHRFAATDPVALWGSKRAKLTGDDKRLPYIDAVGMFYSVL